MRIFSYQLIRRIHLYSSLPIVALILMYILSSYFMIHYQLFGTYERAELVREVVVDPVAHMGDQRVIAELGRPVLAAGPGVSGAIMTGTPFGAPGQRP